MGYRDSLDRMANPYEDPQLSKVLSRKYKIADIVWSDTDTFDTSIGQLDPFSSLMAIPNVQEKLTQFRWLRADVELEVRVNATPFHIGTLMVSHIPRTVVSESPASLWQLKNRNMSQKSQNNAMVLSASTMNNITYTIHREAPILFDPIDQPGEFAGALGIVDFSVLNPLILANGTSPAPLNIAIFASFVNPRPAGYGYFPLPGRSARIEQHSSLVQEEKDRAGGAIIGSEADTLFSPTLIAGALDTITKAIEGAGPAIQFATSMGLSKPPNQTTTTPTISDDFRDLNYTHGVNQAIKLSTHPSASLGTAGFADLRKHKISEVIQRPMYLQGRSITKLDEPGESLMLMPVHPSLSAFTPELSAPIYTPTPLAYVSQAFNYWRGSMKFVFEFITSQFVTARFRITHWPSATLPVDLEDYAGDAVSTVVDVRGDTRVEMMIPYLSPFPYQRCRGYLHAESTSGWTGLPAQDRNSFLTLSLVNSLQQPDFAQDAVIYVNVYVAAGEDFVFGQLVSPFIRTTLETPEEVRRPRIEQHSLIERFSKPFKPLVPAVGAYEAGLVLPEQYTGVEEVCMKYHRLFIESTETNQIQAVTPLVTQLADTEDHASFFNRLFRWNRGGVRYKVVPKDYSATGLYGTFWALAAKSVEPGLRQPGKSYEAMSDFRNRGVLELEIPWALGTYLNSFWIDTVEMDTDANTASLVIEPIRGDDLADPYSKGFIVYRCVADDFVFGTQFATDTSPATAVLVGVSRANYTTSKDAKRKEPQKASLKDEKPPAPELDQSLGLPPSVREKLTQYLLAKSAQTASSSS